MAKRGKRRCEMGKSCPYLKEYQHRLEFSHDNDGDGAGGSGDRNGPDASGSTSFQPFGGGGRSLSSGSGRSGRGRSHPSSSSSSSVAARGVPPSKDAMAAAAPARAPIASSSSSPSSAARSSSSWGADLKETSKNLPVGASSSSSSGWISRKKSASAAKPFAARPPPRKKCSEDDVIVLGENENESGKAETPLADRKNKSDVNDAVLGGSPVDLITPERDTKKRKASQQGGVRRPAANAAVDLCDSESDSDDVVICNGGGDTLAPASASSALAGSRRGLAGARQRRDGNRRQPFDPVAPVAAGIAEGVRPATRRRLNQPDPLSHLLGHGDMAVDPMSPFGGGAAGAAAAAAAAAGMGILPPGFGYDPAAASARAQLQAQQMEAAARARAQAEEKRQLSLAIAASNREVLNEQDREYHDSLAEDQRKQREREEEEQMKRIAEEGRKMEEERAAREEKKERERARAEALGGLEDEPDENDPDAATVAFRMPTKCTDRRVVRRFRRTDEALQLVRFLRGECADKLGEVESWTLREVIGGGKIGGGDKEGDEDGGEKTIDDLGLFPRGVVVVRDEGC